MELFPPNCRQADTLYEKHRPNSSDGQSSSNWTLVTNLTYTQAVLLLGLPEENHRLVAVSCYFPGKSYAAKVVDNAGIAV